MILNNKKILLAVPVCMLIMGLIITAAHAMAGPMIKQRAIAVLHPTTGNQTAGTVMFTETAKGVKITADISGLSSGKHGFHIHQFGDCSAPDGTSAGGHYNPSNHSHAGPNDKTRHVGDLGNITVQSNGKGQMETIDSIVSLEGPDSIIGRAVIVHAGQDDLTSQPTGNAGGRLACGVIGYDE